MNEARRRATLVATATKWLAVAAGLAAPLATPASAQRYVLFTVAVVGAVLRVDERHPALTFAGTVGLMAGAAAAAGASGGPRSFAYAAIIVLAADAAVQRGGGIGALLGGAGTAATVLVMLVQPIGFDLDSSDIYVLAMTQLTGLAFGTIHRDLPITGVVALRATTHALDELVALTHRVQPGLDRWAVADAVVTGLRDHAAVAGDRTAAAGPHLLLAVDGVVHGVGAPWHRRPLCLEEELPKARRARPFRSVSLVALPPVVAAELDAPRWLVHRLPAESGGGAVLADARTHPVVLDRLVDTISTASIALANSARFEELQRVATDAARMRLARDLHDGIAQALTHTRFELELLAMRGDHQPEEVARARGAADAALSEVRRTIGELREDLPLSESLRNHVRTVESFARVPIGLDVEGEHEPPPDVAEQIVRIAQEALSNALRHSGCSRVTIQLHLDRDAVLLSVADDGVGISPDVRAGVGLAAMRERAAGLGGDLRIGPRVGGGTEIELEVGGQRVGEEVGARSSGRDRDGTAGWPWQRTRRVQDDG